MKISEVRRTLKKKSAVIVHFSGLAKVGSVPFPDDLHYSIRRVKSHSLSCHILWPGAKFAPWGEVGIILEPVRASNILAISATGDGGYMGRGVDFSGTSRLSHESLKAVFRHQGSEHNDIRMRGGRVAGILALQPQSNVMTANNGYAQVAAADLKAEFGLPVFNLHRTQGVVRVA